MSALDIASVTSFKAYSETGRALIYFGVAWYDTVLGDVAFWSLGSNIAIGHIVDVVRDQELLFFSRSVMLYLACSSQQCTQAAAVMSGGLCLRHSGLSTIIQMAVHAADVNRYHHRSLRPSTTCAAKYKTI